MADLLTHELTITYEPLDATDNAPWTGRITFDDGEKATVYGTTRERVIESAASAVRNHGVAAVPPETLHLDASGAVVPESLRVSEPVE